MSPKHPHLQKKVCHKQQLAQVPLWRKWNTGVTSGVKAEFLQQPAIEEGPVRKAARHPHPRGLRGSGWGAGCLPRRPLTEPLATFYLLSKRSSEQRRPGDIPGAAARQSGTSCVCFRLLLSSFLITEMCEHSPVVWRILKIHEVVFRWLLKPLVSHSEASAVLVHDDLDGPVVLPPLCIFFFLHKRF